MNKARLDIVISKLTGNSGQLSWLPKNPRNWTKTDIDRTIASIERDPDFLEDRPLLAVPAESGKGERYVVFAGNLRLKACKESGVKTAPVVVYFPETDEDRETVKRRAMLDNGSFGSWNFDALANEWDDLPLLDLGVPAWEPEQPEVPAVNPEDFGTEFSLPSGNGPASNQVTFYFEAYQKEFIEAMLEEVEPVACENADKAGGKLYSIVSQWAEYDAGRKACNQD